MNTLIPKIEQWYRTSDGNMFEIVDINKDEGYIDIQYFDGIIDEIIYSDWDQIICSEIAPPGNWSGSFDDSLQEDMGDEIPARTGFYDEPWSRQEEL